MSVSTKNDEPRIVGANLTPEDANAMITAQVGTVERSSAVRPTEEEMVDGVTSVEQAMISPSVLRGRAELLSRISPDFKGAMVRLQHREGGDTCLVFVETYHGNPIVDGKPVAFGDEAYKSQSERHQDVFVFGTDGTFLSAYKQIINQDMSKPVDQIFKTLASSPIEADGLEERVATLISDMHECVRAGE